MAAAARVDGHDKVIATAQQIVKSLATSKHAAEDMIRILSGFDNRLSTMNDLFPSTDSGCNSPIAEGSDHREEALAGDPRLDDAEEVIRRWEISNSLIWEASTEEACEYLDAVDELVSLLESEPCSEDLRSRAEICLQISMARLEDEFRHLMVRNTVPLDADVLRSSIRRISGSFACGADETIEDFEGSADEEQQQEASPEERGGSSISDCRKIDLVLPEAVCDLKEIADRMVLAGYGREICQVYSSIRRDVLDEYLLILGYERMSIEEVQRIEWQTLNEKMKTWIQAMKIMVRVLLTEEKNLCEQIFASSVDLQEECFTNAAKGCIMQLLNFGDAISICQRSAEKLFRTLDMYEALDDVIPVFHSLISGDAHNLVCSEAEEIKKMLADAVRGIFMDFANAVQKEASRKPVQGGEIHPLSRYVMNYVKLLVDYSSSLNVLLDNEDFPEEGKGDDCTEEMTPLGRHLLLLLSYLETNLEQKSKNYEDGGLQFIFLMNNILYIVQKIKDSELLKFVGDDWVRKRRGQVRQHATSYLRASWTKVLSYLKDDGLGGSGSFNSSLKIVIKERFKSFNLGFEELYRNQTAWKVSDPQLREELRISISEKIIPAYRAFFGRFGSQLEGGRNVAKYVKYTPEELENYLSDFFEGLPGPLNHPKRKLNSHYSLSYQRSPICR
ncbi:hypothetical protein AXF42_Ash006164 [Apostasia shenzhenica]|uniref:Exocyst subunit Exo70 family protein n=1 Tax=Apostasia shenzhenica TaxID=1088818 RepID=A0A2I0B0E3_9ASPA|nr:hypothetical protein AXF42_Ash006164 [Apostasia shenzhenica]